MTQNTSQQIVVISQEDDPHIPHVQSHLACPLIVLDRATILQGHPQAMLYNRADKRFEVLDGHLLLDKVTAVWFRKPIRNDQLELPVAKALQRYVQFAFNEYSQLLYRRFQDALWISNFDAIRRASDKLLQLELASRLGFNVPETLVTSSPAAAKHFVASHLPCISKPIECEGFVKGEQMYYFFTNKVKRGDGLFWFTTCPCDFSGSHRRRT